MALADCYRSFPSDTLHIAVVDPGVGTSRSILYAENRFGRFLAPDKRLAERNQSFRPL